MHQSKLFTKTRKEAPSDEESLNAKILIRGGFIHKELAGVYDYLPLGLRVLGKINNIIREEMNVLGSFELSLSALQNPDLWQKTNRWDDSAVDVWFKTNLKNGSELGLGFTHEEPLTNLMSSHISSYRDLPVSAYQIQTKFRNETRAKSGLMRGREFLMKDMYSFSKNESEHAEFYEKTKEAYLNVFERVGLKESTFITFASGGSFSKYSHEFQTITASGEDLIYICDTCRIAVNKEIIADQNSCPECNGEITREEKAVEVGNIFNLGTKFSDALGLAYSDENGEKKPVVMGSYGIGPGRVLATVVEVCAKGINEMVWPKEVSPFDVHIVELAGKEGEIIRAAARNLYENLKDKGVDALYDDRELSAGEKFADADLIGVPVRIIVGKSFTAEGKVEIKIRDKNGDKIEIVDASDLDSIVRLLK